MKFSISRALIIARREYVTTVKRKAFVFSLVLTPMLILLSTLLGKSGNDDTRAHARQGRVVALVDSSGLFANAPATFDYKLATDTSKTAGVNPHSAATLPQVVHVVFRPFAVLKDATDSLTAGNVNTVLLVRGNFLQSGGIRRFEKDTRAFTGGADDGALRAWATRALLANAVDPDRVDRVLGLHRTTELYVLARSGGYELKDDARETWAFLLPFALALVLGVAIVTGGQYLLQGVSEEKETRILESLLCTVTPEDLVVGKLVGLGGAGLTMMGVWMAVGLGAAAPAMSLMNFDFSPVLFVLGALYFLLGYLFYASLMTGIGAITNNMREAQQLAMIFTMMNFIPFYALVKILNNPNSAITIGMSLFPPTAPVTMMMRLSVSAITGAEVPLWQVASSLGLLALAAIIALKLSSKVFRIGLLLYGKTPTLPEIMKIVRQN